ncbi:MAG: ATP-binding protein [Oscillospiraceae bacterium]|nr:ATP-binding protein [Oscillospiraceae bacterium]
MGYDKKIYAEAKRQLALRKQKAESGQKARHDEICLKFPEILRLEREMAKTGAEAVRAIGMGADAQKYIDEISAQNLRAQRLREKILTENGYDKDYLKVQYTCEKCRDTGLCGAYVCDCYNKLVKQIAFEELSRSSPMKLSTFESFKVKYYPDELDPTTGVVPREHMTNILHFCRLYAAKFSTDSQSLLMYGKTGLGKTHLSLAIAGEAVNKGFAVIYDSTPNIMNRLESEHFGRSSPGGDTLGMLSSCDLLILDDLGAEFQTSFTVSCLYNIVNNRLLSSLPTIISTNLDPRELEEKYTQRIASRFVGTYINLGFCGNDIRQIKK